MRNIGVVVLQEMPFAVPCMMRFVVLCAISGQQVLLVPGGAVNRGVCGVGLLIVSKLLLSPSH
jgi:hypothetical protein